MGEEARPMQMAELSESSKEMMSLVKDQVEQIAEQA